MGLITEVVKIKWNSANKNYYKELGYKYTKMGDEFEVKVEDLSKGSGVKVERECDCCKEKSFISYNSYIKLLKEDGTIYCNKCAKKLYGGEKIRKTKLNKRCNSIAQYILDNFPNKKLEEVWDYERNGDLDPWDIGKGSKIKCWFICQEKDYHESYISTCNNFSNNNRCPFCSNQHGIVHPLDSLGQYVINNYGEEFLWKVWSDRNEISPFECTIGTKQKVWWKCLEGEHEDYLRSCLVSKKCKYNCPECFQYPTRENHPKWNPNLTQEEREKRREGIGIEQWRKEVYERDNYTCQCCGDNKGGNLVAHHLNSYNWDKEHRTDVDNGITLCEECHKQFHKIYGYGNNSKEQFEEYFKNNVDK